MMHNNKTRSAFILVALLCSACAATQRPEVQPTPLGPDGLPVLTDAHKEDGVVCERRPKTGSRVTKLECTTAAQREHNQRIAREQLEQVQIKSKGANPQ